MTTRICPEDITVAKLFVFKSQFDPKLVCNLFLGWQELKNNGRVPRWKATGNSIPFPVFHGTWFVGLPAEDMIEYMSACSYKLVSETDLGGLPTRDMLHEQIKMFDEMTSLARR